MSDKKKLERLVFPFFPKRKSRLHFHPFDPIMNDFHFFLLHIVSIYDFRAHHMRVCKKFLKRGVFKTFFFKLENFTVQRIESAQKSLSFAFGEEAALEISSMYPISCPQMGLRAISIHTKNYFRLMFSDPLLNKPIKLFHSNERGPRSRWHRNNRNFRIARGACGKKGDSAAFLYEKRGNPRGVFFKASQVFRVRFEKDYVHG